MVKWFSFPLLLLLSLLILSGETISSTFSDFYDDANTNANAEHSAIVQKDNNASLLYATTDVALSANKITPGQQLTLTIAITFADNVEVFIDASQVNWQPFTLLNHHKSSPQWLGKESINSHWKIDYTIDLIVPLAGEYQLPEMILNSYLKQQHHSQVIQSPKIIVTSSFPSEALPAQIQPIEKVKTLDEPTSKNSTLIAFFIISIAIIMWLIARWLVTIQKNKSKQKNNNVLESNLQSPIELIAKAEAEANESEKCDWEELRQCMLLHLGFDPLNPHINSQHLSLSNRYISARFTHNSKAVFIELCVLCQNESKTSNALNTHNSHNTHNAPGSDHV